VLIQALNAFGVIGTDAGTMTTPTGQTAMAGAVGVGLLGVLGNVRELIGKLRK
jgi:hypothetical protein